MTKMENTKKYKEETEESGILDLWEETFGDSREYCRMVYRRYSSPRMSEAVIRNETVAATLAAVGFEMVTEEETMSGHYICQLATRPEFRGEGLMSRLLRDTEQKAASEGETFTFLIPADENLRKMYTRKGYRSIGTRRKMVFPPVCENRIFGKEWVIGRDFSILANDASEGIAEKLTRWEERRAQQHRGIIRHSDKQWQLIIEENRMNGGTIIYRDDQWFAILERREENTLTVREILINPNLNVTERIIENIHAAIITIAEDSKVTYLMPSGYTIWKDIEKRIGKWQLSCESDKEEQYAMFKELQTDRRIPEDIIVNLMLD